MTTDVLTPQPTRQAGTVSRPSNRAPESLLPDQHELLRLLAGGLSDQAIGRRLDMSRRTVQRRVRSLMDHFGVQTRFQLGMRAAQQMTILNLYLLASHAVIMQIHCVN